MPFTVIEGTFHVVGYSPDGDSIKFKADNKKHWKKVKGKKIKPNGKDHVQLRVEGIDSLETHYKGPHHQPKTLANAAGDELMNMLGIRNVKWGPTRKRVTAADDGTKGYILTRETGPYGRPICFLFTGSSGTTDGSEIFAKPSLIKKSMNYKMLAKGQAYPLFYDTLFYDLRQEMAKATQAARDGKLGIWAQDDSRSWFDGSDLHALQNTYHIVPKIFRRLIGLHLDSKPVSDLPGVLAKERVTILPHVQHTDFDAAVEVSGKKVRMLYDPENLVIGSVNR